MTRDARLSALHRGDFRPGAALPSPAFPPDPCSDAPRSQVVVPGGRCPGPPEPAVTSRGRRTPLPAPPFRTVSGRRPPMSEDGNLYTKNSFRSQHINSNCSRTSQGPPTDRRATTRSRLALEGPHGHTVVGQRRLDLPTVPSRTCR